MKTCANCKVPKPLSEFHKARTKDGTSSWCAVCACARARKNYAENRDARLAQRRAYNAAHPEEHAERNRRWKRENPERARDLELKRYKITATEYDAMLAEQNGVCAICEKPETTMRKGKLKALAVDHDHESGRVRSLLCQRCNMALGMVDDDVALLRKFIDYVTSAQVTASKVWGGVSISAHPTGGGQ